MTGNGRETVTARLWFTDSHFYWSQTTSSWRHKASSAGWASHLQHHVKRRDQKTCVSPGFSVSVFSVCCSSLWSNQVSKRPQHVLLIITNNIFWYAFLPNQILLLSPWGSEAFTHCSSAQVTYVIPALLFAPMLQPMAQRLLVVKKWRPTQCPTWLCWKR